MITERQKEFLRALRACGLSMNALIAVGIVIRTEPSMLLMAKRIIDAEDRGEKITDGLVGQILVDIMKMASEE